MNIGKSPSMNLNGMVGDLETLIRFEKSKENPNQNKIKSFELQLKQIKDIIR